MRSLARAYDGLIEGLAALAAGLLAFITLAIVADVMLRNLGLHPLQWVSAVVEYVLLIATMAASPWLVRRRGHIAITSFADRLPEGPRLALGRAVLVLAVALLALLAWRSGVVGLEEWRAGSQDIRSIRIPGWLAYAVLCAGFALLAAEFGRMLLRGEVVASDGGH